MGYNLFQPATLGMKSHAHALDTIGLNVANVNTGGYKRTDTRFETMISKSLSQQTDLGGMKPKDFQRIDVQGTFNASDRDLDLAINGDGFFYVSPTFTVSDEIFFTRDGGFEIGLADAQTSSVTADDGNTITVNNGYLVDKSGYYVLGEAVNTDGTFTTGSLAPMRVDEWAFIDTNTPTSTASLGLNLPTTNGDISDHLGTVIGYLSGTSNDDLELYHIQVVDSNGAKRTAQLNFTKQSTNSWQVSATTSRSSSPQIDTINFGGTAEASDTYGITVIINGTSTTVNYTSTGLEGGLSGIRDAIVTAVNANATIAASVTASAGKGNGEISLTANAAGTSFSSSATATDGTTAQIDNISIAGTVEAGDIYEFTLASSDNNITTQTISYTVTGAEGSLSAIRDNIVAAFVANAPANGTVIAAAGANAGDITLTARTAGKSFTTTAAVPTVGATTDNTATASIATANITGTNDNTATVAANTRTQTTAPQTLTFNGDGTINGTSPVTLDFALTFDDAATSTFTVDLDTMTQLGPSFRIYDYAHNGQAASSMNSIKFDNTGQVVGSFQDGTSRPVYKMPLAIFSNPNKLEMLNGMVFRETSESGEPVETFADVSERATFINNALEISNVDIVKEFTRMIMMQKAYNSSATVFRAVDEMIQTGRDLKA